MPRELTPTEIFIYFLKHELKPIERKAFVEKIYQSIKSDFRFRTREKDSKQISKRFVEEFISLGIPNNSWNRPKYCSSLSTFMEYLLKYKLYGIIGDSYHKNPYIASLNYEYGKLGYRTYHIKYYCDKWKEFLKKNIQDYDVVLRYYNWNFLIKKYSLKTNRFD